LGVELFGGQQTILSLISTINSLKFNLLKFLYTAVSENRKDTYNFSSFSTSAALHNDELLILQSFIVFIGL
jgi:hypothetical protein